MRRRSLTGVLLCVLFGCQSYDPPTTSGIFEPCCGSVGTCVPEGLVPANVRSQLGADRCSNSLLCVPSALAEDATYVPDTCRAVGDVEGRCLPDCLPAIVDQAGALERGTCAADELCAPCYDPRNGEVTPACSLGADQGPVEPPRMFANCCGGRARCVPEAYASRIASKADRELLGSGSCADETDTCVPATALETNAEWASCEALGGFEGRCVLDCIPEVTKQADQLTRSSCSSGELCAPCFDPVTGEDTKVCTQGDDRPAQPAKTFASCCNLEGKPRGRCVPREVLASQVGAADAQQLSRDTCAARESCVPEAWLDPNATPTPCQASGAFEGRCLSRCLPEIAEQADSLDVSTCDPTEVCVPCFDPRTGMDTGACRTGKDEPQGPSKKFDSCCGMGDVAEGQCVPKELLAANVSEDQIALLGRDSCADPESACVPNSWVDATEIELTPCRASGVLEGRCMPTCVPQVSAQADALDRATCRIGELCVPCYDPRTGDETEACRVGRDQPDEPPPTFPACCSGSGHCMPVALLERALDSTQLSVLGRDICDASDARCVPTELLEGNAPKACRSAGDLEGRCVSNCLTVEQGANLPRDVCEDNQRCAPCYDPRSGEETGVCSTGDDKPVEPPPGEYPTCCSGTGRCVPGSLLEGQLGGLSLDAIGRDTCADLEAKCVPDVLLDPTVPPKACRAPGNLEGRCMSGCLPVVAERATFLGRGECGEYELCVPCYDPTTLAPSGACTTGRDQPAEPPKTFAPCCGTGLNAAGLCVPVELLTSDQRTLPRDSCTDYDARCAPKRLIAEPTQPLQSCTTNLDASGLCFEQCFLVDLSSTITGVLAECGDNGRCVSCTLVPVEGIGCE